MHLILASTSRYRAGLLQRLGLPFTTVAPDVDETPLAGETPRVLVERLSILKAEAGARSSEGSAAGTDALIIGSDQVAVLGDRILGKPGTAERARRQLQDLSGRQVTFLTGLCLYNTASKHKRHTVVETPVWFRILSERMIDDYVEREQPLDCAGAFKSEGLGIALFERMGGPDPNALIGLPLIALCDMLVQEGISVLGA